MPDASEPDGPTARCGDTSVQAGEDCDDGNQELDAIYLNFTAPRATWSDN